MPYSGAMRAVERFADLRGHAERLIERDRSLLDTGSEHLALDVLHHPVTDAMLVADIVQCAGVGMVQRCDSAGFTLETGAQILTGGDVFGQDPNNDHAVGASVAGSVDFAPPSSADRGEHLVRAESVAAGERHICDRAQLFIERDDTWITGKPK